MWLNVAEGLWRKEIVYAKHMFQQTHRDQLMKMLVWSLATRKSPSCQPGKFGRHIEQCLEPTHWKLLLATYSDADIGRTWQSLEAMCTLFRLAAQRVGGHFGFSHELAEEERVTARLKYIQSLCHVKQENPTP